MNCPICGSSKYRVLSEGITSEGKHYPIDECEGCHKMKKRFRRTYEQLVEGYVDVEADSPEDAENQFNTGENDDIITNTHEKCFKETAWFEVDEGNTDTKMEIYKANHKGMNIWQCPKCKRFVNLPEDAQIIPYCGCPPFCIQCHELREVNEFGHCDECKKKCDACGKIMGEGYVIGGGEEYFCSEKCLHTKYTKKEWEEMYTDGGDNYWTQWD
jgi:hypothetical protein